MTTANKPPFDAVIFDFDGVLIDTEPLYLKTVNRVLAEAGARAMSEADNRQFIGRPAGYTWTAVREMHALPNPAAYYQERYDALLEDVLRQELKLRPEAAPILGTLAARGLRRAVATSSRRRWMGVKLALLGLSDYFHAAVSADDVGGRAKPAPDVYVRAAELAGIDVGRAMAIEDSPSGITAAKGAGLYTVALQTEATCGLDLSEADLIITSLSEIDTDRFLTGAGGTALAHK